MNNLANMFQQALPNMPRLNQRLQQPGFGQQQPQIPQQPAQAMGAFQFGQSQLGGGNPQFGGAPPRQPVQNHQYNPPSWANYAGNQQQFDNPSGFGGAFQPPRMGGGMRGGYFDGNLGQPDPWKPWGGWGG